MATWVAWRCLVNRHDQLGQQCRCCERLVRLSRGVMDSEEGLGLGVRGQPSSLMELGPNCKMVSYLW